MSIDTMMSDEFTQRNAATAATVRDLLAKLEAAEQENKRLREALMALQAVKVPEYSACDDGLPCWCGYNVGMGRTHVAECQQARAALTPLSQETP